MSVELDGETLTLESLVAVAHDAAPVTLGDAARDRMSAARALVDHHADGDAAVYGVNTGFGSLSDVRIAREQLGALQLNLIRSHAAGVGEPLDVAAVRATALLRANVLAKGYSGIRPSSVEALLDLLNRGVHAVIPSRGLVGASGDSAPLAHLALVLVGEGEVLHHPGNQAPRGLRAPRRCDWPASRRSRWRPRKASRSSTGHSPRPPCSRWRCTPRTVWRARPTSQRP